MSEYQNGINISTFENGLYFIKIQTNNGVLVKRIIKE